MAGRPPAPILLEKLPLDVFREDTDGVRDEMDEEMELVRVEVSDDIPIDFCMGC